MQFKALLASITASSVLSYAALANAADVIRPRPISKVMIAPAAPAFSWVGPYLGIETGVVMNEFRSTNSTPPNYVPLIAKPKAHPLLGLYTGFNMPMGQRAIIGLDANIDYHPIESPTETTQYVKYKEDALAAVRLRLGLAQGRALPYISGGLSAANAGLSVDNATGNPQNINKKRIYFGWNIGGGIDYSVTRNMFLRLDYRFSQIKIKDLYMADSNNVWHRFNANTKTKSHEVRIGAAYKF